MPKFELAHGEVERYCPHEAGQVFGVGLFSQYFSPEFHGQPFVLGSASHVSALVGILLLNLLLLRCRGAGEDVRRRVRWALALGVWGAELSWHVWNVINGTWSIRYMLPLNMCSLMIWLSGFMLIARNRTLYGLTYFAGIGAAIQYLATPDLGAYGFPHYRYWQAFISHGLLLTTPVYMTLVEGFRPTWKSMFRAILWVNAYAVMVFLLNTYLGSDYLMLNAKPATPSLLDFLPPWPYYLIFMELTGLITFLVLFLPFMTRDRKVASLSS
jgi:hypothetical integral membrane protein (TIGR02206 family)